MRRRATQNARASRGCRLSKSTRDHMPKITTRSLMSLSAGQKCSGATLIIASPGTRQFPISSYLTLV